MDKLFDIVFLDEVLNFLSDLEKKHYEKILFNIRKAQTVRDPELFKKLDEDIWEFRTLYQGIHYRLLAFWTRQNLTIHWSFRLMDLLKRATKCLILK